MLSSSMHAQCPCIADLLAGWSGITVRESMLCLVGSICLLNWSLETYIRTSSRWPVCTSVMGWGFRRISIRCSSQNSRSARAVNMRMSRCRPIGSPLHNASPGMSSDDVRHALSSYAHELYATLKPFIIAHACETGFYVLSILSFAVSTYILVRKGFKTTAILIMWITTFIMFAISTCHFVLQWVGDMGAIMNDFKVSSGNGFTEEVAAVANLYLPTINYSLSDAIVLWRVWIMWGRSMKVLILFVLLTLLTLAPGITFILVAPGIFTPFRGTFIRLLAIYASTLATNIVATTLMAVKAWQHRRLLRSHLNNTEYRSQAGSILILLVESGAFYCVIWISFFVSWCFVYSENPHHSIAMPINEILPGITVQVSGIYPTAVIALAALQRTAWDMSVGKVVTQNAPRTEVRFVTRAIRSSTSTTQTGYHHPTPSIDEELHTDASEIATRDGEV